MNLTSNSMKIVNKEYKQGETRGAPRKYPFNEMQAGQCLVLKPETEDVIKERANIYNAFRNYNNYNNLRWKIKVAVENGNICAYRIS